MDCNTASGLLELSEALQGDSSLLRYGVLSKSVAGSSNVTLTSAEYQYVIQVLTGVLTGDIAVIEPLTAGAVLIVKNETTGNYTLTIQGATGTGVIVGQGKTALVRCDGTNWVEVAQVRQSGRLSKALTGAATLTPTEMGYAVLEFTGTAGALDVTVQNYDGYAYDIYNASNGTVTVKVSGQTGVGIATTKRARVYIDGTDVRRVSADA